MNVRAINAFSAADVNVNMKNILKACQNYSDHSLDEYQNTVRNQHQQSIHLKLYKPTMISFFFFHLQTGNISVDESIKVKISATPDTLVDNSQSVTLSVTQTELLPSSGLKFEWDCRKYSNELTSDQCANKSGNVF